MMVNTPLCVCVRVCVCVCVWVLVCVCVYADDCVPQPQRRVFRGDNERPQVSV